MATVLNLISVEEFEKNYEGQHGVEYWFGKVVHKHVPNWVHSILQVQLGELLRNCGYFSGSELTLRTDRHWQPRPDVAGALDLEEPYPIKPIDIAIEIPSKDQNPPLIEKCQNYARIGIPLILVFDPETRIASRWNREKDRFDPMEQIVLTNDQVIDVAEVWKELDRRLKPRLS
jgi:hypothetical protein